jgi:WhiB family transcriptional regulator, redox-sensing transcriptional regulator
MGGQLLAPVTRATPGIATRPAAGSAARITDAPARGAVPAAGPAAAAAPAAAPAPRSRMAGERPWSLARRPRPVAPLPCRSAPDLFFAEHPDHLKQAQALCATCPAIQECLAGALERGEPCGVWGGKLFMFGNIIDSKRPRGRPRRVAA